MHLESSVRDPSPILSLEHCVERCSQARRRGQRVVLTNGCFDILHRGHFEYLRLSASLGDLLVVAVNSDESVKLLKGPNRPLQDQESRAYALACLRFVDLVTIFPGPRLAEEILRLSPDVYTKASDYSVETLDPSERHALELCGSKIHFLPFVSGRSTSFLMQRLAEI